MASRRPARRPADSAFSWHAPREVLRPGLTHDNAHALAGSALDGTGAFSGGGYEELDVTSLVAAGAGGDVDIAVTTS